jgi:hypothetical protein
VLAAPRIAGTAKVGRALTASTAAPSGWAVAYQWLRAGQPIAGATAAAYQLATADAGARLSVRAIASREGAQPVAAESAEVSVAKVAPTVTARVTPSSVSAAAKATLTVKVKAPGVSRPTGKVTVSYGDKTKVFTLRASDAGVRKVSLARLGSGSYKVAVSYAGSTAVAAKKAKTVKLVVR